MGINVQDIENNTPYSLSVFGDEQIYSGERLGNKVNLNIVFDHPTSDRNWKIIGDGTFGIKKIDGIIHFDSSFGRGLLYRDISLICLIICLYVTMRVEILLALGILMQFIVL